MHPRISFLLSVLVWLISGGLPVAGQVVSPPEPAEYSLEFIENKGQWDARAHFAAPLPGGSRLFVEDAALTFALLQPGLDPHQHRPDQDGHPTRPRDQRDKVKGHVFRMEFVGAKGVRPEPAGRTSEIRNYLLGNDASRWASEVGSYRRLQFPALWPGISARLYENGTRQLEYDFDLAAQADARQIRVRYAGADALRLTPAGALEISTSVGTVTELAPQAWQIDAQGQRQAVRCRYVLKGREVSFELGRYDHSRPLTIDPTLVFSSFTGATADNWGFTATYGPNGNLYSGGIVIGVPGYPVSPGAFDTTFNGIIDIGIIKYNPNVSGAAARVWATYIGGSSSEFPHSLVVNDQDELIMLGTTSSATYPVSSTGYARQFKGGPYIDPYDEGALYTLPNGSDLVVTHLNAAGSALVGSTFLGGTDNDGLLTTTGPTLPLVRNYGDQFRGDVLVDAAGDIYVASCTMSADFPVANGFNGTYRGGRTDAVVCKLNANLSSLLWSGFLGGTGADAAYSLQLAADGNVFVCGGTTSNDFPTQPGALIATSPGAGAANGYVARIGNNGTALQKATYLGTVAYDQAYFVQLDLNGDVYILGQSLGSYPVTAGRYQNAGGKQFIHKLNADLSATLFSTVFGTGQNNIDISPTAFLVDQCNRIYVSGWGGVVNVIFNSASATFLVVNGSTYGLTTTANAFQRTTDGSDFYLMQLAPDATALEYATYFGGNTLISGDHVDGGTSRFDRRGYVYQAICGGCGGLSALPSGLHTYTMSNNSGNCNNAAFKFNFDIPEVIPGTDRSVCADAGPVPLGGSPGGGVWTGPGVSGSGSTGYVFTPSVSLLGVQTLTYTVTTTGVCSGRAQLRITVAPVPTASISVPQTSFCQGGAVLPPVTLGGQPAGGTFSGPGVVGNTFSPTLAGVGNHTLTYSYTLGNCTKQASQTVSVVSAPVIGLGADTLICPGSTQPFQLSARPGGGIWSGPNVTPTGLFTPPAGFSTTVTLTYTLASCASSATKRVGVFPAPAVSGAWAPVRCPNDAEAPLEAGFTAAGAPAGATFQWEFGDGGTGTGSAPTHTYTAPGRYQPRLTVRYNNNQCSTSALLAPVEVEPRFAVPNIITPNGDRQNETFVVTHGCPPRLQVFSRWGNQVYEAAAYANNWAGADVAAGLYYYLLRFPDGRTQKGWLEIVR